jgi:hypothetical protein
MDQPNDRDEQKAKPETQNPQKPKRFQIVRLEERIAPKSANAHEHPWTWKCNDSW